MSTTRTVRDEYLSRGYTADDLNSTEPLFPDAPAQSSAADAQGYADYTTLAAVHREGYTFILGVYPDAVSGMLLFGPELGDVSDVPDDVTPETFESWIDECYP